MSEETETFLVQSSSGGSEPLTRNQIRVKIREGTLKDSVLIWNEMEREWKPAHTFPWLKKTTILPTAAVLDEIRNRSQLQAKAITQLIQQEKHIRKSNPTPKVHPKTFNPPPPQNPIPTETSETETPSETLTPTHSEPREEIQSTPKKSSIPFKENQDSPKHYLSHLKIPAWIYPVPVFFILLFLFIVNWWNIQHEINTSFKKFSLNQFSTPVSHYQYYLNPNVLIVNFPDITQKTSPKELVDILTVLAKIKERAWTGGLFREVQIQKQGKTIFLIKGSAWTMLSNFYDESAAFRSVFLIRNLYLPDGSPFPINMSDRPAEQKDESRKSLAEFCSKFISSPVPQNFFDEAE